MKKIILSCLILLACWGTLGAQQTGDRQPRPAAAAPLKADGTPDMRYKVNKERKKAKGPLKKDGTPDRRFKANKTAS